MVGFALTLADERSMHGLAAVIRGRLTPEQRGFLAMAALLALTDEEYRIVIDGVGRR